MSIFDETYYSRQREGLHDRVQQHFAGLALLDYLWLGASERLNPSAAFDESYYLESNPDVAAAMDAADFICGYHHYLKVGMIEGRRAVPPVSCCVIDAGLMKISEASTVADLASHIQQVRPSWSIVVIAGFQRPARAPIHPWVRWSASSDPELEDPGSISIETAAAVAAANFVICLAAPTLGRMEHVAVVALGDPSASDKAWSAADAILAHSAGASIDPGTMSNRLTEAVETVAQVKARMNRRGLASSSSAANIKHGLDIPVGAGDGPRVVTIAIELPQGLGPSKELLLVEGDGERITLEVTQERLGHAVFRIGPEATQIIIRPKKPGYSAAGLLKLARIEAEAVDLLPPLMEMETLSNGLVEIDLNTDLARVKRELGRFISKADTMIERRPALEFGVPSLPPLVPFSIPRCLIISTFDAEKSWAESGTFDVAGLSEYLDARGFLVEVLELPLETATDPGRLHKLNLTEHKFLVLTGPRAADLLDIGLSRARHIVRVYRGGVSGGRLVAPRLHSNDLACAQLADRVIVSSPDEAAYYRSVGVQAGRIDYVSEFLPSPFRRLARPYEARQHQVVLHLDSLAILENRVAKQTFLRKALKMLIEWGWRIVVSASPRLRSRIEESLDLGGLDLNPVWCDPSAQLPTILHSTRLVIAPQVDPSRIGGLISAARIIGVQVMVDGPLHGPKSNHLTVFPTSASGLKKNIKDPGSMDVEATRAEAYRSLDRILGFRGGGWREGRGERAPDI